MTIDARLGPASATRKNIVASATAVQATPRIASEAMTSPSGVDEGIVMMPTGVSNSAAMPRAAATGPIGCRSDIFMRISIGPAA